MVVHMCPGMVFHPLAALRTMATVLMFPFSSLHGTDLILRFMRYVTGVKLSRIGISHRLVASSV